MIEEFEGHRPDIANDCFIASGSRIIGRVKIGSGSSVWHNTVIRGDMDDIIIGENVNIQDLSVIHCDYSKKTTIESDVTIGHGAILHSCSIGKGSLIGMGAIVLDGVVVGKSVLIGAGSLLTPNTVIPDYSLVLGSPAKVIRALNESEIEKIKSNAIEYKHLSQKYKTKCSI